MSKHTECSTEVFVSNKGAFIHMDTVTFSMALGLMGANVLNFIKNNPPTYDENVWRRNFHGVVGEFQSNYPGWADHGYTNSLLGMISMIEGAVTAQVKDPDAMIFMSRESMQVCADALDAYQEWRDKYIAATQAVHGKHWGSSLWYYNHNFNTHVPAFRKLFSSNK